MIIVLLENLSQGIYVNNTVYVSGQLGLDPDTMNFVSDEVEAQTRQSIRNISAILEAVGLTLNNVVKTTVLLADMDDFAKVNAVYAESWRKPRGGQRMSWQKGVKEITKSLGVVGAVRLPGWGPRDPACAWLETLQEMAANRCNSLYWAGDSARHLEERLRILSGFDNTGNVRLWLSELLLAHIFLVPHFYPVLWSRLNLPVERVCELGAGMSGAVGLSVSLSPSSLKPHYILLSDGNDRCVKNLMRVVRYHLRRLDRLDTSTEFEVAKLVWPNQLFERMPCKRNTELTKIPLFLSLCRMKLLFKMTAGNLNTNLGYRCWSPETTFSLRTTSVELDDLEPLVLGSRMIDSPELSSL
ncbi:rutC family protein PH0854 [Clonorchis sinensis]|uniref:RutC family protein PH0854 n=1 Tax=Clonorchis sinensis TaxID=79923 RepID=G7Y579_CLOSI|nr:rutC family protein PH0854 [Clonorchis sinensis]